MTKLWLLKSCEDLPASREKNPWHIWWDKTDGWVIRADTEEAARGIAQLLGDDETGNYWNKQAIPAWSSSEFSICTELLQDGKAGVILKSFNAG